MICYDSWFPEVARMLSFNGAELVLFPSARYYADLMPARTADNGLWIAASSLNGPAGIWDSASARAGEPVPSPTRYVAPSIHGFSFDQELQVASAQIDLSRRLSLHWWGGPMGVGARRQARPANFHRPGRRGGCS